MLCGSFKNSNGSHGEKAEFSRRGSSVKVVDQDCSGFDFEGELQGLGFAAMNSGDGAQLRHWSKLQPRSRNADPILHQLGSVAVLQFIADRNRCQNALEEFFKQIGGINQDEVMERPGIGHNDVAHLARDLPKRCDVGRDFLALGRSAGLGGLQERIGLPAV